MLLRGLACCFVVFFAACTSSNIEQTTNEFVVPKNIDQVMLVQPDVELALLTASGLNEPRADWSTDGETNLAEAMKTVLADKTKSVVVVDLEADLTGDDVQLIKLHNAVAGTVFRYKLANTRLPTKKGRFDYTLGEGVQRLKEKYNADYAIFTLARGNYSSAGRVVSQMALAYFGAPVQFGSQAMMVSLVDLNSGDILWFNFAVAGPGADMRKPEGAQSLVQSAMKTLPLLTHADEQE